MISVRECDLREQLAAIRHRADDREHVGDTLDRGRRIDGHVEPAIVVGALAALGAVAALGLFAVIAATLTLTTQLIVVLALAAICGVLVFRAAHLGSDLYAVPMALAAVLAFDFFYLPPLRTFGFPDYANWGALLLYLGVVVFVCTISARTRRKVDSLDRAQGALANEQAALRRVATLVAEESPPSAVFSALVTVSFQTYLTRTHMRA